MTVNELLDYFGNISYRKVAEKIGVSASQIVYYQNNGIPIERQLIIQAQTKGALKADDIENFGIKLIET